VYRFQHGCNCLYMFIRTFIESISVPMNYTALPLSSRKEIAQDINQS